MIDLLFLDNQVNVGADSLLFEALKNHMASVLERVLQTSEGKQLTKKYQNDPRLVWKLHKDHETLSTTSSNICTGPSQELAKIKIVYSDHPTKCLDTFDSYIAKLNKISKDNMPELLTIMYLKSATYGNEKLLSAWVSCEAVTKNMHPNTTPTYDEYFEYMLEYAKKLEAAVTNNTTSRIENVAKSDYLQPYSPSDEYYDGAAELSFNMEDQGEDVDIIHDVLQCNKL